MGVFVVNTVFFAVAIVCFYTMRKAKSAKKPPPWWIVPALAFVGGSCIAASALGQWLASLVGGVGMSVLIGAITLILVVCIVLDLRDKTADKMAMFGLIVLPVLFAAGTGPLADLGNSISGGAADGAAATIGRLIGG